MPQNAQRMQLQSVRADSGASALRALCRKKLSVHFVSRALKLPPKSASMIGPWIPLSMMSIQVSVEGRRSACICACISARVSSATPSVHHPGAPPLRAAALHRFVSQHITVPPER